jgi:hypothetical protein
MLRVFLRRRGSRVSERRRRTELAVARDEAARAIKARATGSVQ